MGAPEQGVAWDCSYAPQVFPRIWWVRRCFCELRSGRSYLYSELWVTLPSHLWNKPEAVEVVSEESCDEEVSVAAVYWFLVRAKAGHHFLVRILFHLAGVLTSYFALFWSLWVRRSCQWRHLSTEFFSILIDVFYLLLEISSNGNGGLNCKSLLSFFC